MGRKHSRKTESDFGLSEKGGILGNRDRENSGSRFWGGVRSLDWGLLEFEVTFMWQGIYKPRSQKEELFVVIGPAVDFLILRSVDLDR